MRRALTLLLLAACTATLACMIAQGEFARRGACDYIRPFHYGVAIAASCITTVGLAIALRVVRGLKHSRYVMAMFFVSAFLLIWMMLTPSADAIGKAWEMRTVPPERVAETGYGWFYWDDSGMGHYPTPFYGHILVGAFSRPAYFALLCAAPFVILLGYPKAASDPNQANKSR